MQTDWHLTYPGTDFAFGTIDSQYVFPQSGPPSVSNTSIDDQDAARPRGDGVLFGEDFRAGTTITFDVEVHGENETEVNALLDTFNTAWRADPVRNTAGAVAALTSHTGRTVFGRPRRFQQKYDLTPFGVTAVTCDFETADDLWYGPLQTATVNLVPAAGGGLVAPLAAPLSTTATSDRSQTFTVSGRQAVWPTITIQGPITNPTIEVVGQFKLGFNLNLTQYQTLVVDTAPWARTSLLNGASVAGKLMPLYDRLSDASVPPGRYDLALRGTSTLGTAYATIAWRDAFPNF